MSSNFESNLKKLRGEFLDQNDLKEITTMANEFTNAKVKKDLFKHDGMRMLIKELEQKVEGINHLLQHDRKLTERERDKLFMRRDGWEWFLAIFPEAKAAMKSINKSAEDYIKNNDDDL